ncbi:MAG: photosynthetic complex putative assembly protein PuhB [Longimicrobiales bacterium]|nr:photosynthetic complex putative assembly protein PuhB [Longimicrobiales bacterium]
MHEGGRQTTAGPRPVEGFEQMLPDGERVLWSGASDSMPWLRRSLALRAIGLWVGALTVLSFVRRGGILVPELSWIVTVGIPSSLFVAGFVLWTSRSTRYLIADRRVAMAIGLTLPGEANIPLTQLQDAAVRRYGDGSGDIALLTRDPGGVGYLVLWPHVRAWRLGRPEPTLRALPDLDAAGQALRSAIESHTRAWSTRDDTGPGPAGPGPEASTDPATSRSLPPGKPARLDDVA